MKRKIAAQSLEDMLMPDNETLDECSFYDDEPEVNQSKRPLRGIYSDAPDRVSQWIEKVSHYYHKN